MGSRQRTLSLLAWVALLGAAAPAVATRWTIDPGETVFAILTHKAGFASGLAHDHLVIARGADVALDLDPAQPEAARLVLTVRAEDLEVDAAPERARWGSRLRELGALGEDALPPIPEKDRAKVREAMLGRSQLDAPRHPEIRAELLSLERRGAASQRTALGWTARVRLTVRGRSVERDLVLRWSLEGDRLAAEGLGEARFTDLGIQPYSAFLGAVKNTDLFHLYVSLVAERTAPGAETPGETSEGAR